VFYYSRDRTGEHPQRHLQTCAGILQADAYGGYSKLYEEGRQPGLVLEAACFDHARRRFFALVDEPAARESEAVAALRERDTLSAQALVAALSAGSEAVPASKNNAAIAEVEAVRGRLAVAREAVRHFEALLATARRRLSVARRYRGVAPRRRPRGDRGGGDRGAGRSASAEAQLAVVADGSTDPGEPATGSRFGARLTGGRAQGGWRGNGHSR
jgi:hypothetical protein